MKPLEHQVGPNILDDPFCSDELPIAPIGPAVSDPPGEDLFCAVNEIGISLPRADVLMESVSAD